jgi:1,4-alpha-glucan branching enzyme
MMKRLLLALVGLALSAIYLQAQLLTWTPDFPKDNDNISITVDATKGNQGLQNYNPVTDVYIHTGVITNQSTSPTNWRYVKFNQNFNQPNPQLQATSLGGNKWKFDITNIRAYYGVPAGETILKIAVLFRNGNGSVVQRNANGDDMYVPVYDNGLAVRFTVPPLQPLYIPLPETLNKTVGDNIPVTAIASQSSNMKLYLNGTVIQTANSVTTISANPTLTASGNTEIVAEADNGTTIKKDTLRFFVVPGISVEPLPGGVRDGINYETGNTAATLVLYAPGKTRVSIIGEFPGSNWIEQSSYVMKKTPDGNYWWLRITGLTPGTEYAFQYLVDGTLKIAEPYAEKILDPYNNNDQNIPATTYPGLRAYPAGQTGIVSLLQTNAATYNWQVTNFQRPDKRMLVTYELLVRDFVAAHDWKTIRDSLNYLKNLGINAIEIMPFNEFEGNDSWGYNPDFYFAPDKYYGPKNTLKEFIDSCHKKGIAVIMDIALNHSFGLSPMVQLYWDAANNRPAANNPWFNPVAKHAFNVGFDMNHESLATRYFVSRVVEHWLTEYKIDGFRFDLSKGFTQVQTCDVNGGNCNVDAWGNYDASRVAIWKRYYDTLQLKSPGSYAVLEHFAADPEEIELSNYGMMFWGNSNHNYNEASMGWVSTSNFERAIHSVRNWTQPFLMSYMESHDEERLMYKNINFGNSSGTYNTRDLNTALKRMEQNAAFFLTIPGPKMIWQFGELGYDFSINRCVNGTIDPNCRLSPKPIRWDYFQETPRRRLYDIYSSLNKLRFHGWYKDVFIANNITLTRSLGGGFKWLTIRSATDSSMLCVVGNFDVTAQTAAFTFPAAGTWYDYLQGGTFTAASGAQSITLQPGEFHVYLNRNLTNAVITPVPGITDPGNELQASAYPNPVTRQSVLDVVVPAAGKVQVELLNALGQRMHTEFAGNLSRGKHLIPLSDKIYNLPAGIYLLLVNMDTKKTPVKLVIQ